jgi:hypothetical protein
LGEGEPIPWYEIEWQVIDHGADYAEQGSRNQMETLAKAVKREPPAERW